jgi:hypothetical protein
MSKIEVNEIARRSGSSPISIPGHIIQVVQGLYEGQATSSTSGYADTGLSAVITPQSSNNKILVNVDVMFAHTTGYSGSNLRLVRGSTTIYYGTGTGHQAFHSGLVTQVGGADWMSYRVPAVFLDSPSTTSATTYKVQFNAQQAGSASQVVYINRTIRNNATFDNAGASTITLMEVAV